MKNESKGIIEANRDKYYGKIKAMYCKGYSNDQIVRACPDMCRFEVLDVIQKLFALEQIGAEWR